MDVFLPSRLGEALEIKGDKPECLPIAGGTDVMVGMNFGWLHPTAILDLSRIEELRRWKVTGSDVIVGSGVSYTQLISDLPEFPPLAAASRTIGSPQIRNRGTIGGNLGTASPAGDALPVLAAFDAQISMASHKRGERLLSWDKFLVGPKRNSLQPDELVTGISWRAVRGPGIFSKIGPRNAMVIAIASLCLVLDEDTQKVRVAVGSVAPTVLRLGVVEGLLNDTLASSGIWDDPTARLDQNALEEAVFSLERSIDPITDVRGTASYRKHVCGVLLRRALKWALQDRSMGEGRRLVGSA